MRQESGCPVATTCRMSRSRPTAMTLRDGSVVIAAITSCTNTSNPSVMVAAGPAREDARSRPASQTQPWVKTSLAPGSRVVTDYLDRAGLTPYLDKLGLRAGRLRLHDVHRELRPADRGGGARRGRGRPQRRRGALGQPELRGTHPPAGARVLPRVAAARAWRTRSPGRVDIDLTTEPLGDGADGAGLPARPLARAGRGRARPSAPRSRRSSSPSEYGRILDGDEHWRALDSPSGLDVRVGRRVDVRAGAAVLRRSRRPRAAPPTSRARACWSRSATRSRPTTSRRPARSRRTRRRGDTCPTTASRRRDFNSYGSRRGNHEVMMRGTFANIRLRNELAPGTEGLVDDPPARRRGAVDLRRRRAVPGRGRAARA